MGFALKTTTPVAAQPAPSPTPAPAFPPAPTFPPTPAFPPAPAPAFAPAPTPVDVVVSEISPARRVLAIECSPLALFIDRLSALGYAL